MVLGAAGTMTPVSLVLFAREAAGSFGVASVVLGAATAGGLALAPVRGRLVDRRGPAVAVLWLALPSALTNAAFLVAGHEHAPGGLLVMLGFVSGAVAVPAGAALRGVWSDLLASSDAKQAGYALMTVNQEVTFVLGPLLAGGLIALASPGAAVAAAAGLELAGALVFATAHAARAVAGVTSERRSSPVLASPGLRTVLATAAAFGAVFGVLDVALPAVAVREGSTGAAGLLLAALALGIGTGGALYGTVAAARSEGYPALCLLAATGLLPLLVAEPLGLMAGLAFVAGLGFAPVTTAQIAVVDRVAPEGRRGEAFSWIGTLYGVGSAAGAVLGGQLLAHGSPRAALLVAPAAAALAWVISAARAQTLGPAG